MISIFANMEREIPLNKVSVDFAVKTNETNINIVTDLLSIEPTRWFNKGDLTCSKHTSRTGQRPYGLWVKESPVIVSEELNLANRIKYFNDLFWPKLAIIEKFKLQFGFECIFSIYLETEDVGLGFDLTEEELSFIAKISTRFCCSFISKDIVR